MRSKNQMAVVALAGCVATVAAYALLPTTPAPYLLMKIMWQITPFAAVLGAVGMLLVLLAPVRWLGTVFGWAGCVVLALTAGGLLHDGIGVLVWITGNEVQLNWTGMITRGLAGGAAVFAALATAAHYREAHPEPRPWRPKPWFGYTAFLLGLPYPLMKTYWALGGTAGLGPELRQGNHGFDGGWLPVVFAIVGMVLSLALVQRWGRIFPRWSLLVTGWFGTAILGSVTIGILITGLLTVFGVLPLSIGDTEWWIFLVAYGSWVPWTFMLAGATWNYQQQTRTLRPASMLRQKVSTPM